MQDDKQTNTTTTPQYKCSLEKLEYHRQYYKENREDILKKLSTPTMCDLCGKEVRHQFMQKHLRTNICKKRAQRKQQLKKDENTQVN